MGTAMGSNFIELLKDSESVTNVTIGCSDGVIYSHKIIAASVSDLIKDVIGNIPAEDDVTLLLPDFGTSHVQDLLSLIETSAKTNVFGSFLTSKHDVKKEMFHEDDNSLSEGYKDPLGNEVTNEEIVTNIDQNEDLEANNKIEENQQSSAFMKEVKGKALKLLRFYETSQIGQFIQNPITKVQIKRNKMIQQRILCKKAVEGLAQGLYPSVRSAAMDYGICYSILWRSLQRPQLYVGSGSKSPLTMEEENHITKVALEMIRNSSNFTSKYLKQIIEKEVVKILARNPERNIILSKVKRGDDNFIRHFADRNGLKKFMENQKFWKIKKDFVCDVCHKDFTIKSAMIFHQKNVHEIQFPLQKK